MPKGGARKGAGRKKGQKTRVTEGLKSRILADKRAMPVELMLEIMREPMPKFKEGDDIKVYMWKLNRWQDDRMEMAKAAAPYTSPRLESVEYKGDKDHPLEVNNNLVVKFVTPP